jgi:amidohydrolase
VDTKTLKTAILNDIDFRFPQLKTLSHNLHENPETAMTEYKAAAWLKAILGENGFRVETGIYDLPTAFRAVYGKGKPGIGILAEYDALPKVGHACGHNLIATTSVAAGIASKLAVEKCGGSIIVYGTPGEEGDAGKALMAERGAFKDIDVAMICHPGGGNAVVEGALACQTLKVEFIGKAAHAAFNPESGINALEAMILSFNAVNALRQHIRPTARIHGIITHGGDAANIVPEHTSATFYVRAADDDYLDILKEKVVNCFKAGAIATGATLKHDWEGVRYAAMRNNFTMAKIFQKNMETLGIVIPLGSEEGSFGSTDVGNVSAIVPSIQPYVSIAPDEVSIHSPDFEKITGTEPALRVMLEAAKAMAFTVADLLADTKTLKAVRDEFSKK